MLRCIRCTLTGLLAGAMIAVVPSAEVRAQAPGQQLEDVVYLKDGSVIRGTIVEQRPGESVLIRTRDGNQFRYRMDQIDRLAKEPPVRPTVVVAPKSVGAAIALSLLLPGAGQGYNGQWGKAGGFFLVAVLSYGAIGAALDSDDCVFNGECGSAGGLALVFLGNYVWSVVDAGVSASKINAQAQRSVSIFVAPGARLGFARAHSPPHSGAGMPPTPGLQLGVRVKW